MAGVPRKGVLAATRRRLDGRVAAAGANRRRRPLVTLYDLLRARTVLGRIQLICWECDVPFPGIEGDETCNTCTLTIPRWARYRTPLIVPGEN